MYKYWYGTFVALLFVGFGASVLEAADDAYIKRDGAKWTIGTATVERVISMEGGKLLLESFKNKATGREMIPNGVGAEEFSFSLGDATNRFSGASGGFRIVDSKKSRLKNGERKLDITLQREGLQVTKSYVVYPKSSIIREWLTFKNAGTGPLIVIDPAFLNIIARCGDPSSLDFNWMTGGGNSLGSWKLRTESLTVGNPRKFDSYEPFPIDPADGSFPGDGVNVSILQNDRQIWPESGWQYLPHNGGVIKHFDVSVDVAAGDKLVFVVNMNKDIYFDTTEFDPTITYADGESHTASKEFSKEQGKNGWRYQYIENGKFIDLVYYSERNQWRKEKDNAAGIPFVGVSNQHPDPSQDSARVWIAPKAGRVHITGDARNIENIADATYGFRPGSSSYAPWYAIYGKDTKNGLFIGWDYFGHWKSSFEVEKNSAVNIKLVVAGFKKTLAPGESFITPKAFVGLFKDDLDNAGNECLDWQYNYLWDYTRDGWFPAIRMLGYWWNGTGWGQPGVGWLGGNPDWDSTFRKVFRVADLMRYCGADVYHRDWGWWDKAGDWNGPDWRTTINYLRKYDMGQLIYAFLYTVDLDSKVAKEHPEWVIGNCLDMSKPEVVEFMKGQLDNFVSKWGNFEWRNDSIFLASRDGDDTVLLSQDQGLRQVIQGFLDKHPKCAFQAVNGGGSYAGYDYTRFSSSLSFSDGAVGILRNYYASLLFPPDKTSDIPDFWRPDNYDQSIWRGLLCINFDMSGDTTDPQKLDGIRELIDIYHYLQKNDVVGRWVKVYRPMITGDDPTMYLQRLSGDRKRGIIIPKHQATAVITIRPKGLLPSETYLVSFQESQATEKRTGADLMANGVKIEKMLPGELIYLNLPMHPGSKLDTIPPSAPTNAVKRLGENMGYPGVELAWKQGSDNNWISYCEVFRNGISIDKVSKGEFYFDHSAGADLAANYEIRTVDGAVNVSQKIAAAGPPANPARVYDDSPSGGITFTGDWEKKTDQIYAYNGTLTFSNQKGATAELTFEGKEVLWFTKLGADCGKAEVSIDGGIPEVVDTYSADDIWGVCIYRKALPIAGKHTLRINVLEEKAARASNTFVYIDGIRAEQ